MQDIRGQKQLCRAHKEPPRVICAVELGATDASEGSPGMCGARVVESLAVRLYALCEGPGEYVYLAAPYVPLPAEVSKCSLAATLVVRLAWQCIGSCCFKASQHINILEARVVLEYTRWLISRWVCNSRCNVFANSGVVKGAIRKSRSFIVELFAPSVGRFMLIIWYLSGYFMGANVGECL